MIEPTIPCPLCEGSGVQPDPDNPGGDCEDCLGEGELPVSEQEYQRYLAETTTDQNTES